MRLPLRLLKRQRRLPRVRFEAPPALGGVQQARFGRDGRNATSLASIAASQSESAAPPAWVQRMRRSQAISRGVAAAEHAVRAGDHPSAGGGVDLSEGD